MTSTHWGRAHIAQDEDGSARIEEHAGDRNPSPLLDGVLETLHGTSRITRPAVRKGWLDGSAEERGKGPFIECDWDEVFSLVETRIRKTLRTHSNSGIFAGSYGWGSAGRFHHSQTQLKRFLNTIGGFVDQRQTYSYAAGQIICPYVVGDNRIVLGSETTSWRAITQNARVVLFFGGVNISNLQIASGGLEDHQTEDWLRDARDAGLRMISIGPVRDRIDWLPELEWVPIRPGTDVALMLAVLHELIASDRTDRSFLDRYTVGYEQLAAYVLGKTDGTVKTAEWASKICDIPLDTIRQLAALLADTPSFLTASWSLQRQHHGEQPYWMLIALAAALGQIGLPGCGVSFGYGSIGNRGIPKARVSSPRHSTGDNPTGLYIPVSRFADMMLNPGKQIPFDGGHVTYPEIDLVWWAGGNPFHHHQDINRLRKALQRPSTVIVNEISWTGIARHADIVLPAASGFERNDISTAPSCDHVVATKAQLPPFEEAKTEFEIFSTLAERFGTREAFTEGLDEMAWLRRIYDDFRDTAHAEIDSPPEFEEFWEHGAVHLTPDTHEYTLFEDFRSDPEMFPLATPSGRIEIYSERLSELRVPDFAPHPTWNTPAEWLGDAPNGALHLMSPQPRTRLHSQLDGTGISARSKINGREPALLHPDDAAARGLVEGDTILLWNSRGRCLAGLILSEDVRPGVAVLATGAWYDPDDEGLDLHGNPNVLTSDLTTSALSQGPAQNTTLIFARKADREYPQPSVHTARPISPIETQSGD